MSLHYSAAWGQTLRSASLKRQKTKPFVQDPIPTFFNERQDPRFNEPSPLPEPTPRDVDQNSYDKASLISNDLSFQKRFSKEFVRAITVQDHEEAQTVPVVPRFRKSEVPPVEEFKSIVPNAHQGFTLNMNKLSLISLIFGLLLLGLLFFLGGFMLAINFFGDEAPHAPPAHSHSHQGQNPLAGQLIQHTPAAKIAPIVPAVAHMAAPAPAAVAPVAAHPPAAAAPAAVAPVAAHPPAAAAPAPAAVAPVAAHPPAAAAPAPAAVAPVAAHPPAAAAPAPAAVAPVAAHPPAAPAASAQNGSQEGGGVVDASELTRPYALQVGIYAQRQGAQQIVNTLQRRGYQAYVVAVQMEGQGEVYAVRMGGYFTHVAAYNAAQHLTHKERFKVMAVARNNNAERVIL